MIECLGEEIETSEVMMSSGPKYFTHLYDVPNLKWLKNLKKTKIGRVWAI